MTRKVAQNTRHVRGGAGHETSSRIAVLDRWNTQRCQNFDCPKSEEAKIRLFASMMDNMTGKEMAVLIIDHICMMVHISCYVPVFHLSGHGPVPL